MFQSHFRASLVLFWSCTNRNSIIFNLCMKVLHLYWTAQHCRLVRTNQSRGKIFLLLVAYLSFLKLLILKLWCWVASSGSQDFHEWPLPPLQEWPSARVHGKWRMNPFPGWRTDSKLGTLPAELTYMVCSPGVQQIDWHTASSGHVDIRNIV